MRQCDILRDPYSFIKAVKRQYAHPISSYDHMDHDPEEYCYCVGGAIIDYLMNTDVAYWKEELTVNGETNLFPAINALAIALLKINPFLDVPTATEYARDIMHENDTRNFTAAWYIALDACRIG